MALKALEALTRLKSGFHLAELEMMSPVLADTNFLGWGTMDKYSATRPETCKNLVRECFLQLANFFYFFPLVY